MCFVDTNDCLVNFRTKIVMKLQFYLHFNTRYGQQLFITGNIEELGNNDSSKALLMDYLNEEFWHTTIEIKRKDLPKTISYKYILKNGAGEMLAEWGDDRSVDLLKKDFQEIQLTDIWNHAGEYENAFFTAPFNEVLLKTNHSKNKTDSDKDFTHIFKVKAPLLKKNEVVCLLGGGTKLGEWLEDQSVLLGKDENWWSVKLDLSETSFPVAYKYGVYDTKEKKLIRYEDGNNRLLYSNASKKKLHILHDGFVQDRKSVV